MTTKLWQALKDLEATCEDLADLEEAFKRGRLQGLEEAANLIEPETKHSAYAAELWAAIREKIKGAGVGAQEEKQLTPEELQIAKLRYLLYEAIVELEYVQCSEDHSLCASAKGREIVERGMKLLEVKDLSQEHLVGAQEENTK